jgi:kexin
VRIAIVDNGLDSTHEDLQANVIAGASYDYLTQLNTLAVGDHGTGVAGLVAAVGFNDIGVRGVAPSASLVAYNVLQQSSDVNMADALNRGLAENHIYSKSWAAPYPGTPFPASQLVQTALEDGLLTGRNGLGAIYTKAAGNDATILDAESNKLYLLDNANYDGVNNLRGMITVGAVTDQGKKSSYSEPGANLWVSAPGGEYCGTGHTLTTTDESGSAGNNPSSNTANYINHNYTKCFNGTSAATPLVSGVIALMLQANPNLGWRDVPLILAKTARQNDPFHFGWTINGGGFTVNHNYGFGVVDAGAAVTVARDWINVGPEKTHQQSSITNLPIQDATANEPGSPTSDTLGVSGSGINQIEFIEVVFDSDHEFASDLEITLTGPSGTESVLAQPHFCEDQSQIQTQVIPCGSQSYSNWRFATVRHLGEGADGDWTLTVRDGLPGDTGRFVAWGLKFYGR